MTAERLFGRTPEGEPVFSVDLEAGGLSASVISWGATLRDLRLEGHEPPLVLGYHALPDYLNHSPYFGATVGRFANRIAHGAFQLDGAAYQLDRNENGRHHLHGGTHGIGQRPWRIGDLQADRVRFEIDDPDGQMGYPGRCRMSCSYHLKPGGVLSVVFEAEAALPTPCGMAHHSYFNLDGRESILDHELMVAADSYLPVDADQIPTGEIATVIGTPFDFTQMRPIRHQVDGSQTAYDHNFCLSDHGSEKRSVALLTSPFSGVSMEIWTTEPGLQVYCGSKIDTPVPGLQGARYGAYAGLCLETQRWPDSPNQPSFPDAILRPGETLTQATDYIISRN